MPRDPAPVTESHPLASLKDLTVQIEWDDETQSWVTCIPELNGISTFGATQEEALQQTRDLVIGYLDSMEERGLQLPVSRISIRRIREALA